MTVIHKMCVAQFSLLFCGLTVLIPATSAVAQTTQPAQTNAPGAKPSIFIYRLRNADANFVAKGLTIMFGAYPTREGNVKKEMSVVVDERTNSVLVTCGPQDAEIAKQMVGQLDEPAANVPRLPIEQRLDHLERELQALLGEIKSLKEQMKKPSSDAGRE